MKLDGQDSHPIEPLLGPVRQDFQLRPFNIHFEQVHPLPAEFTQQVRNADPLDR